MERSVYMLDLLRPTITLEDLLHNLRHRPELTEKDLDEIIKNANRIKMAAKIVKSQKQQGDTDD